MHQLNLVSPVIIFTIAIGVVVIVGSKGWLAMKDALEILALPKLGVEL